MEYQRPCIMYTTCPGMMRKLPIVFLLSLAISPGFVSNFKAILTNVSLSDTYVKGGRERERERERGGEGGRKGVREKQGLENSV